LEPSAYDSKGLSQEQYYHQQQIVRKWQGKEKYQWQLGNKKRIKVKE